MVGGIRYSLYCSLNFSVDLKFWKEKRGNGKIWNHRISELEGMTKPLDLYMRKAGLGVSVTH